MSNLLYKICSEALWQQAEEACVFAGAPVDQADGFIHFSTAEQVRETARRHFGGQTGLLLIAVDAEALGCELRWEPSRGGQLFPHLFAPLNLSAVRSVEPLELLPDGSHRFPPSIP